MTAPRFDIAIVGAGIAGASLAATIGGRASVALIEGEDRPGYHATGRSAAFWAETYGGPGVYPLTASSHRFLEEGGFLTPRGALNIGRKGDRETVRQFIERFADLGAGIEMWDRDAMERLVPGLRPEWTCGAWEGSCADIDVAALHAHYLGAAAKAGIELRVNSRLVAATRDAGGWALAFANGEVLRCEVLVDAAGAWADPVAVLAGVRPLGIAPLRRTVAQLRTAPPAPATLPLVLDIKETFYFKPESGRVWLSPHDETPSDPCDAAAEEIDVAVAIDRMERVVDWRIEAVERKWAGLRSFAPDRLPVYGFDARVPGFFWCAGQGGFGIQTAPAGAALAASLLLGGDAGAATAIDPAVYAPSRFG